MKTKTTAPRIYVACLAAYNDGKLHGKWIDCDQDADAIWAEIADMLKASPVPNAEEWAIHDHEGWGIKLSEHESIEKLAELAAAIEEHGEIFALYMDHVGDDDVSDALRHFEENYQGDHDSLAEYVEARFTDTGSLPKDLPDIIKWHIDWEAIGHELEVGGDIFTIQHDGKLHVFYNN